MIHTLIGSVVLYIILYYFLKDSGLKAYLDNLMPETAAVIVLGFLFYLFILYAYFHQIIVFDRSVTPRMMVEIRSSENRALTLPEMKKRYSLEDKLKRELGDMVYMGRMTEKDGVYRNTAKGLLHAKVMDKLRAFMHIGGHQ